MKLLTIRLTKSGKPFQVVIEDSNLVSMTSILESSSLVSTYHVDAEFNNARDKNAMTNTKAVKSLVDTIDSWVSSPPDCNCPKCISNNSVYMYKSYEIVPSTQMLEYFYTLLCGLKETERYKWGIEYIIHAKCRIAVHNQGYMTIMSNKPEIRIGAYIFVHADKSWRAAK